MGKLVEDLVEEVPTKVKVAILKLQAEVEVILAADLEMEVMSMAAEAADHLMQGSTNLMLVDLIKVTEA